MKKKYIRTAVIILIVAAALIVGLSRLSIEPAGEANQPQQPAQESPVPEDIPVAAPAATPEPAPEATPAPTPEATPEPTPEATPEPTPEATPEPTPEATPAPTPEATPAPTPEATPAPTPEATPAPTPEATPAPTPEATPAPTPEATPEPTPEATPEATPVPDASPAPETSPEPENICTICIRCDTLLDTSKIENEAIIPYVPPGGIILGYTEVEFTPGESVFDILYRITRDKNIHMEFREDALYNGAYIEGISYIYEFDGGPLSGWMYKVNGWFPNYGCSNYTVEPGDVIVWVYTCDLGADVGDSF